MGDALSSYINNTIKINLAAPLPTSAELASWLFLPGLVATDDHQLNIFLVVDMNEWMNHVCCNASSPEQPFLVHYPVYFKQLSLFLDFPSCSVVSQNNLVSLRQLAFSVQVLLSEQNKRKTFDFFLTFHPRQWVRVQRVSSSERSGVNMNSAALAQGVHLLFTLDLFMSAFWLLWEQNV